MGPSFVVAVGGIVATEPWPVVTVLDLPTRKEPMSEEPVVRLI